MEYVPGVVLQLTDSDINLFKTEKKGKDARGWLLDFCERRSSDCLSELNRFFYFFNVTKFFMIDMKFEKVISHQ